MAAAGTRQKYIRVVVIMLTIHNHKVSKEWTKNLVSVSKSPSWGTVHLYRQVTDCASLERRKDSHDRLPVVRLWRTPGIVLSLHLPVQPFVSSGSKMSCFYIIRIFWQRAPENIISQVPISGISCTLHLPLFRTPDLCFLCTTPTWMCVHTIGPCVVLYCLFLASIIFFKNLTRYSLCEETIQHYSRVWRDGQWLVQYFKNSGPAPPTVKRDKLSVLKVLAISLYLTLRVTSTKNL